MTTIPRSCTTCSPAATTCGSPRSGPDGMPNVSIKGSGALLDDEHLYFADMFSHKTRENLEHDPRVAVGIHDPERKVAMQVKGHAELIDHGDVFDQVNEKLQGDQRAAASAAHEVRGAHHRRVGVGHGARTARRRGHNLTDAQTGVGVTDSRATRRVGQTGFVKGAATKS